MNLGKKYDTGKPQGFHRIPPEAREALAAVLAYGAEKYAEQPGGDSGWRTVPDGLRRYRDARDRHINAIDRGETHDPESGMPHSWHVLCNDAFIVALEGLKRSAPNIGTESPGKCPECANTGGLCVGHTGKVLGEGCGRFVDTDKTCSNCGWLGAFPIPNSGCSVCVPTVEHLPSQWQPRLGR